MSSIMRKTVDHVNQSGEPASNDVLEAIHAVMHAVRSHEHRTQHEGEAGLTPLEGRVLIFFARRPGATQSDLAAHSGRDKGQLARLINGLRARGLLDARPDEADRRVVRLRPAAAAQAHMRAVRRQRRQLAALAESALTADERRSLLALLDKVRGSLDAAP